MKLLLLVVAPGLALVAAAYGVELLWRSFKLVNYQLAETQPRSAGR